MKRCRKALGRGRAECAGLALLLAAAAVVGCADSSQPEFYMRRPLSGSPVGDALQAGSQAAARDALAELALQPGLSSIAQRSLAETAMSNLSLPSDRGVVLRAILRNPSAAPEALDYVHALLEDRGRFSMGSERVMLRCPVQALDRRWDLTGERPIPGGTNRITQ